MSDREFSESVQYQALIKNLEMNNGQLKCVNCGKIITKKSNCHFDHIQAYAKGGRSTLSNCQILCADCNERKNAKRLEDFLLEEKAKRFLTGEDINDSTDRSINCTTEQSSTIESDDTDAVSAIKNFISKNGDIKKVDFSRPKNKLPSISYVRQNYGTISALKIAFGLNDLVVEWDRETIMSKLIEYIQIHGALQQKDLTKGNGLPSLPCILSYFPEYQNFSGLQIALGLETTRTHWTRELAIERGKVFLKSHTKVSQYDLKRSNGLPSNTIIERLFGSLAYYQKEIGSPISKPNEFISKEYIKKEVDEFFDGRERIIESRKSFFRKFKIAESTITKRFETFDLFCAELGITVIKKKKMRFTKDEVDQIILDYLKNGNTIPSSSSELVTLGLPSRDVILKYYDDWKEPFYLYKTLHDRFKQYFF